MKFKDLFKKYNILIRTKKKVSSKKINRTMRVKDLFQKWNIDLESTNVLDSEKRLWNDIRDKEILIYWKDYGIEEKTSYLNFMTKGQRKRFYYYDANIESIDITNIMNYCKKVGNKKFKIRGKIPKLLEKPLVVGRLTKDESQGFKEKVFW